MKGFLWDVSPSARVTVVQVTFKEKFFNIIVGGIVAIFTPMRAMTYGYIK